MEYGVIENDADYDSFCKYMEDKKPDTVNFDPPYAIVNNIQIKISPQYNFVFEHLAEYVRNLANPPEKIERKLVTVDSDDLLADMTTFIDNTKTLAFDTETTGLNTIQDKVIGFSVGISGEAYYIPHLTWDTATESLAEVFSFDEISGLLNKLKTKRLVTWNGSFDIRFVDNFFGIDLTNALHAEVMLMKHTTAEEGDFSLKGNAIAYQSEIGLDIESEANQEQIAIKANVLKNGGVLTREKYELYKADLEVMGKYAAADADLTFRLFELFEKKLEDENLTEFFYETEVMPTYKEVVMTMERNGVKLDLDLIHKTDDSIKKEITNLEKEVIDHLNSLPEVKQYKQDKAVESYPASRKGKFATYLLDKYKLPLERTKSGAYSFTAKAISKLPESFVRSYLLSEIELDPSISLDISMALYDQYEALNIGSKKQMGDIVFGYLNIEPLGETKGGSPQFNEEFIQHIADKYAFGWAKALSNFNKLIKIKGTYIDRFLDNQIDGYYFFSYKQHGTISGRLSGDAQQLPRPKEEGEVDEIVRKYINEIRAFFIAGEDRVFIDCDYESLEPHIFAHVSGDERLRDIFRKGHDFYSTIAIATEKIEGMSADKKAPNYLGKLDKPRRQASKCYSLGVPYGMSDYALGMTLEVKTEEAKKLIDGYLNGFPELKKWMHKSEKLAQHQGYIVTEAGRVRHLPKAKELYKAHGNKLLDYKYRNTIKKKYGTEEVLAMYRDYKNAVNNAKNVQIQSLGASIINQASVIIMREFVKRGYDAWVCAQLHDQLIFNVPLDKVDICKTIIQDFMENTTKLSVDLKAPPAVAKNWRDGH